MTSPDDFSIALHIGAHKTASTHLQHSLRHRAEALADAGVRYYGPAHLRLPGRSINALFGIKRPTKKGIRSKRAPVDQLALLRKGAHRLVLSEENFAGHLHGENGQVAGPLYPHVPAQITALAQATGQPGLDVFLAIRNPATFLNSAYSQVLFSGHLIDSADYIRQNPLTGVDWPDLVARMRAAPGVGALTVWRYEDYQDVFGQIVQGLVGTGPDRLITPVATRPQAGLSVPAIADIFQRHAAGAQGNLAQQARVAFPVAAGHAQFDCFASAGHDAAAALYQAQCDAISRLRGVTMLRPEPQL